MNQPDELTLDGGSSGPSSGFSAPEKAKAKAMPGDDDIIASKAATNRVKDRESLPRLRSFRDYWLRKQRDPAR